jgi:hypothetical protein
MFDPTRINIVGYEEGSVCGRNGCKGVIELHPEEGCSCHINPPCSACTTPRAYCEECEWEESEDRIINDHVTNYDKDTGIFKDFGLRKLDVTKIDWYSLSHTHFSMVKEGCYPEGTTPTEVLEKVKGTFGGRFEYFKDGKFKYIAYTD